jgi:hypothetical protein
LSKNIVPFKTTSNLKVNIGWELFNWP